MGYYWSGVGIIALLTLLLSSLLNLVYYGPVVIGAWMHSPEESTYVSEQAKNEDAKKTMLVPMLLLSLGVFLFGVWPRYPLNFVRKISNIFFP